MAIPHRPIRGPSTLSKLIVFVGAAVFGLLVLTGSALYTLNQVKVGGTLYRQVIESKDLRADLLPPPLYIVEGYLLAHELAEVGNPAARDSILQKLRQVGGLFQRRYAHWLATLPPSHPHRDILREGVGKPAIRFFDKVENQLIPASQRGDLGEVRKLLRDSLDRDYRLNRRAVDSLSALARSEVESREASAGTTIAVEMGALLFAAALVIGSLLVFAFLWLRQVPKVEKSLLMSEERFQLAVNASSAGLWDRDLIANTVYFSPVFKAMIGYTDEEFPNDFAAFFNILHPEDKPGLVAAVQAHIGSEKIPYRAEYRLKHKNGEYRWFQGRGEALRDGEGRPYRMLGSVIDITEQRRAEEEIRRLNTELEQRVLDRTAQLDLINRELQAFSYSVSHDLRAPLRGIDGWSLVLQEDYADKLDAQGREYLQSVRSETQRMGHIIDDMLNLSRVTKAEMRIAPVDLSRLASAMTSRLAKANPLRKVECRIEPGMHVHGDAGLLEMALNNLFENAWKFTSRKDAAHIEFFRTEGESGPCYCLRDDGAGFDMAHAGKLFSPFQRLHKYAEFPGTGIGLATVHRVISRHGGKVWAESRVNEGTRVYFTLPIN